MGHIDLRSLPLTMKWRRVAGLLGSGTPDPAAVAAATATAAIDRLDRLKSDPGLTYCVWLLVRLASAAQRPDFDQAVATLGLDVRRTTSVIGFLTHVTARVREEIERHPGSGPFGEIAAQSLAHTLTDALGGDALPLFGSTLDEVERAFQRVNTATKTGHLVTSFFGELLARVLRFYVDRALPLTVGRAPGLVSIQQSELFVADLSSYARSVASLGERFAVDWFGTHHWQSDAAIGRDEVRRFVAHAIEKFTAGLQRREAVA